MVLGRTPEGAVKIKKDGGLRAVNCACCVPKCYPVPFDPTGWVIIPTETGNDIFNRNLTVQMSYNGTTFSGVPFSKSSPSFAMTRTQNGDDCIAWQGDYAGLYPTFWYASAALFRISGIFYFSYLANETEYEPNISSADPPFYVDNFADSSSATLLGNSVFSIGFCSIPAFFGPHISNVTIAFT
jgi:hypothetical protein